MTWHAHLGGETGSFMVGRTPLAWSDGMERANLVTPNFTSISRCKIRLTKLPILAAVEMSVNTPFWPGRTGHKGGVVTR